jgi:Carboxylesterase family
MARPARAGPFHGDNKMAFIQRFGPVLLVAACAALSSLGACGGNDDSPTQVNPTQVNTTFGGIQGVDDSAASGTYAWRGVPFAKPPVDALRWMAPVDPDAWTTTRATTQFANACVQYGRIYGPGANNTYDASIGTTLNQAVGSEDSPLLPEKSTSMVNRLNIVHAAQNGSRTGHGRRGPDSFS